MYCVLQLYGDRDTSNSVDEECIFNLIGKLVDEKMVMLLLGGCRFLGISCC